MHTMCVVSVEATRGQEIPWNWNYRPLEAALLVLEPVSCLQILLTNEPSLQSICFRDRVFLLPL